MNFVYCRQKTPVRRVITYTEETAQEVIEYLWERDYSIHKKNSQLRVTPLGQSRSSYIDLNDVLVFSENGFSNMTLDFFNDNYEPCSKDGHTYYGGTYGI